MKRLYFEQRFYIFLILAAIFGLVGDRAYEWQKGAFLDDVMDPDSFEMLGTNQLRLIASDPSADASAQGQPQPPMPSENGSGSADPSGANAPLAPLPSEQAGGVGMPPLPLLAGAPALPSTDVGSPPAAPAAAAASAPAVAPAKVLPTDNVVLAEAAEKFHRWNTALQTKDKKQRPPKAEMVSEINKLLTLVGATTVSLSKSEAYRLTAAIEILVAREVWVGKKVMLRKRAYGHLQESIKAFPGNLNSQWAMGLAVLTIAHLNSSSRPVAENFLGIHIDDELKTSIFGVMPFTDNLQAQFLLETLLQVKDSRKQLAKEDAQVLTVVKQNVKNFRAQPARVAEVKAADAALDKFRIK